MPYAIRGRAPAPSSGPGRIAGDITVEPPEPRTPEQERSVAFLKLRATVGDLGRAEHRAHQSRQARVG
ncbi:hypothetical protein AB0K60_02200 [Thermopolyspora sp. NPDC052614]|uniref:hypothetical protein n=1 Tax=Thermopolyspora sp. NPDC052614 TaxID=3155682 RepID=UPI00341B0634